MRRQRLSNLSRTLGFSGYTVRYLVDDGERRGYADGLRERFGSRALAGLVADIAAAIDVTILDLVGQDYTPHGASAAGLTAAGSGAPAETSGAVLAHLDKSHIGVHTYPEPVPGRGVNTFRIDVEVSTCGDTSPLAAVDRMLEAVGPEVAILDYRVRGFVRDGDGRKRFTDDPPAGWRLDPARRRAYEVRDDGEPGHRTYHCRLRRLAGLEGCVVGPPAAGAARRADAVATVAREVAEIFYGT